MLSIRVIVPVITSVGLLVSAIMWPPGVAGASTHTASVAGGVAASVIASPAKPVGYQAHVAAQPGPDRARYVGLIEGGGADSMRDDVTWSTVEPAKGTFEWSVPDEIVAQAAEHHLHPLLTVDESPLWASGGSEANSQWYWLPPAHPVTYGVFAAAVAARYGPGGAFWKANPELPEYLPAGLELWNEENLRSSWGGGTPSPGVYAAMVKAAYSRIKAADPSMTVVLGGLAPQGAYDDVDCTGRAGTGHDVRAWNGLDYLQALYADGTGGHFDAVGWHAYHFGKGWTAAFMLRDDRCSAWSQLAATTPESVRSLMIAHGDAAKKIWATEAGAPTCVGSVSGSAYGCVLPAQQADLAASEMRIWKSRSWAGGYYWYEIRDDAANSGNAFGHFGAVTANDSPKPAYRALAKAWAPAAPSRSPLTLAVPGSRAARSVAFSADGKYLAAGEAGGHLDIWQVSDRHLTSALTDPLSKGISSVSFNPAGSLLASGDANGHVYLWAGGKLHATLTVPASKGVRSVAFSADGKFLAAGDANGHVYVWKLSTDKLANSMANPGSKGVRSVAFNPASSLLAAGDANGHTYLWASGLAATLTDPSSKGVSSVVFSHSNTYLATGDASGKAYIWKVRTSVVVQPLTSPDGKAVDSVTFNPGATLLATADARGHIYVWTNAPKLAGNLTDPHSSGVPSVAFSPSGQYLAAADTNGHVYLWPAAAY